MYTIAITGGIGSGKSVVSAILRIMGYSVYDTDAEARRIMDTSPAIKQAIADRIAARAITPDGQIDRVELGRIVFADQEKLQILNHIVHASVREHFCRWREHCNIAFVETAILYQSHIDTLVDEVWEVTASENVRIDRVMKRNGIPAEHVRARIESQRIKPSCPHPNVRIITNEPSVALLPQILDRLRLIKELCGTRSDV